ncbi:MAG: hypothetical protein F7B78_00500 [Desulfurococcales archaeon]|nr:hypothetical protein [Desulfurococcales archaeon]
MDSSELITLLKKVIEYDYTRSYAESFLPGHLPRLYNKLLDVDPKNIRHYKVDEYNVFIVTDNVKKYMDLMKSAIRSLKAVFDETESLGRNLGIGEWVLDYASTIRNTLSHDLRQETIPIGAFIVGKDVEAERYFIHILPLPMSVLLYKCRRRLTPNIVKAVMGFDFNYWEYQGGPGRVRVQGDLVIEVIHNYKDQSPCQALTEFYYNEIHNTIKSIRRDVIYQRLTYRILREIEADHVIMRKNKNFIQYLAAVLTFASNYVIKDLLGKRHPDVGFEVRLTPRYEYVDGKMSFLKMTVYIVDLDNNYPHHLARLNKIINSIDDKKTNRTSKDEKYENSLYTRTGELINLDLNDMNLLLGSYVKGSLYSRIMHEFSQHELYLSLDNVIIAIDIDDLVDFIDYYVEKRLEETLYTKLSWDICGEPSKSSHWGSTIFDGVVSNTAYFTRYVLGLSKITIDRHEIELSGIDLTHSLTAKALRIKSDYEGILTVKKYLLDTKRPNTTTLCTREVVDALARFFGTKEGEIYALVENDIDLYHPEHGSHRFEIKHPTIVKFTLLNSTK